MDCGRGLAWVLVVLALAATAAADTLHLKNGTTLQGKVVTEDGSGVDFKVTGAGQVRVEREKIEWIEPADQAKAAAEFAAKHKAATEPQALIELARWAVFHGMKAEAATALKSVLEQDPQNAAAHEALGHRRHEGKWLSEDEYMAATGHVKHQGRWVTKEEGEQLAQGWEFVDGKLVSPDDVKKAKGWVQVDGKWVTKKEAEKLQKQKEKEGAKSGKTPEPGAGADPKWGDTPAPAPDPKEEAAVKKSFGPGWRVTTGKRYRLITDCAGVEADHDKKVVDSMDAFWPVYCEVMGVNPVQKKIHNLLIHKTKAQYDDWCKANAGAGIGAYGTYANSHTWQLATLYDAGTEARGALFTGRHECAHQFIAHYMKTGGGVWFDEGLPTLFESDIKFPQYPFRWSFIRSAVIEGKNDISLRNLVDGRSVTSAQGYSLGAAAHWFFLSSQDGAYRKAYRQFLRDGPVTSSKALEKAIGKSIDELDKEFRAYIKEKDPEMDFGKAGKQTGPAPWEPPKGAGEKRTPTK